MEDPRIKAASLYQSGNKYSVRDNIDDLNLSIRYYSDALLSLSDISEKEKTEKDTQDIRSALSGLLKTMNKLITRSLETHQFSRWDFVLDRVDVFLRSYVSYIPLFNQALQRLPGLDELESKSFGVLYRRKELSEQQRNRIQVYIAIVSLFHSDIVSEKELKKPSEDPAVTKAFAIYERAKKLVPVEPEEKPPLPLAIIPPPALVAVAVPLDQASVKKKKHVTFDFQFAPDDEKRAFIMGKIKEGNYAAALKVHPHIFTCTGDDYRRAGICQRQMGDMYFEQDKLDLAMECYKEGIILCKHVMGLKEDSKKDQEDREHMEKLFRDCAQVLSELSQNLSVDFPGKCKVINSFLDFYFTNLSFLNMTLDFVEMHGLIELLESSRDEGLKKITEIYLTLTAMFKSSSGLEGGQLTVRVAQLKKEMTEKRSMDLWEAFVLFSRALEIVEGHQHTNVVNPELVAIAAETEQKRVKLERHGSRESLTPSYLPRFGLERSSPKGAPKFESEAGPQPSSSSNGLAHSN